MEIAVKKQLLKQKYYYVLHDKSLGTGGQKGSGFYYGNEKKNFYLRFAIFEIDNLIALVRSQHSLKKIKELLSKPKPLLINRCCGFNVLEKKFRSTNEDLEKRHFQISYDKGKSYFDYVHGSNNEIDSLFKNADVSKKRESDWVINDFAEIFEPYFGITEVTKDYKAGVFQLNRF